MDEEAGSHGAVNQEVSGATEPKTGALEKWHGKTIVALFSSLRPPLNFTRQPEQKLSFGGIFKHA